MITIIVVGVPRNSSFAPLLGIAAQKQPVNGKFTENAKGTQNYLECDPDERNPTHPVVAPHG